MGLRCWSVVDHSCGYSVDSGKYTKDLAFVIGTTCVYSSVGHPHSVSLHRQISVIYVYGKIANTFCWPKLHRKDMLCRVFLSSMEPI